MRTLYMFALELKARFCASKTGLSPLLHLSFQGRCTLLRVLLFVCLLFVVVVFVLFCFSCCFFFFVVFFFFFFFFCFFFCFVFFCFFFFAFFQFSCVGSFRGGVCHSFFFRCFWRAVCGISWLSSLKFLS